MKSIKSEAFQKAWEEGKKKFTPEAWLANRQAAWNNMAKEIAMGGVFARETIDDLIDDLREAIEKVEAIKKHEKTKDLQANN